jgi:hypothetical protein
MMGMRAPETCWAVHKHQVTNLRNCCILLVDLFELYDDARTCKFKPYCEAAYFFFSSDSEECLKPTEMTRVWKHTTKFCHLHQNYLW